MTFAQVLAAIGGMAPTGAPPYTIGATVTTAVARRHAATRATTWAAHGCAKPECFVWTGPKGGVWYVGVATQIGSTVISFGPKGA